MAPATSRGHSWPMRHPWANLALLALIAVQLASGLAGLFGDGGRYRIAFIAHAIGAYAIFVVLYCKVAIVRDSLGRRAHPDSLGGVIVLSVLLVATLLTGLLWITAGRIVIAGVSLINLHAYLAITLSVFLAWHALDRRWIARAPHAADRRAFLRAAGLAAAGAVIWQIERGTQAILGTPGSDRRITGSYETGSFTGDFPATSWLDDDPEPIDLADWRLVVDGAVERRLDLSLDDLAALEATTREATIDCTGGWYSRQRWTGVPLAVLLEMAGPTGGARSVAVTGVTGYGRKFSLSHARDLLVATSVADSPLDHGHGAPARLVVPGRRGYDWVKWITRIEVTRSSHLLQWPLPVT